MIKMMIDPKDIIEKYSVEELNETAEVYFSSIEDPTYLFAKPFSGFLETPMLLENVGVLLSGAKLTKSMVVLDFAAGTCWLSYYLNQLQCQTISCDVSQTALDIGKQFFEEHPLVRPPVAEPKFLQFDGYKIDLPDNSVDRILCNDGFHHVPNQKTVLAEFARVLKDGGIAGFSEPGRYHSQTPQSQHEMKHFTVLENDILLNEIHEKAMAVGFSSMYLKILGDITISLREYNFYTHPRAIKWLQRIYPRFIGPLINKSIFFLTKGEHVLDSRGHEGLHHTMSAVKDRYQGKAGEIVEIPLKIKNSGSSIWLNSNYVDIGIVKIGTSLVGDAGNITHNDFAREVINRKVMPGETLEQTIHLKFDEKGEYNIAVDLVSEEVLWFKLSGSEPLILSVEIT